MKILHVYDQNNRQLARYVSELCRSLAGKAECMEVDEPKSLKQACVSFCPDIVHQHGHAIGEVPTTARLVVSPHGEETDCQNAYVVIARSGIEARRLGCLRIETIQNPLVTKTVTFTEVSERLISVYQHVMDSHPVELMSDDTRHTLAVLLKAGLRGDRRWLTEEETRQPDNIDWRRLYIYAEYEGVLLLVYLGLQALGITAPEKEKTISYLPDGYTVPTSMAGKGMVELLKDIKANGPSLLRLTDIDRALHDDEMDESRLIETLEDKKLKSLFQSVLQLLSEQTMLTEGFMPCKPLNNQLTQQLRQQLVNRLKP